WRRANKSAADQQAWPARRPPARPNAAGGSPETTRWETPRRRVRSWTASEAPSNGTQSRPKASGTRPTQTMRALRVMSKPLFDLGGDDQHRGQPLRIELIAAAEQRGHARAQAALGGFCGLPIKSRHHQRLPRLQSKLLDRAIALDGQLLQLQG